MKPTAFKSVQCAEFGIPSCHYGSNESVHIGKNLVSFLSTHMPHLKVMHLWRPDDFPWTSSKFISSMIQLHNVLIFEHCSRRTVACVHKCDITIQSD